MTTILRVDALDCAVSPGGWPWARREAAAIEAHWTRLAAANPRLYDGRVLLLRAGAREADGVLRGACFETAFKAFIAWRDLGFPDASVRNAFAMAALRAQDGAFLVGEMAAHTANAGRLYFPAGTPEPADIVAGRLDFEGSARRELFEETGLEAADAPFAPGWTLVSAGPRLACMKIAQLAGDAQTWRARIHAELARQPQPELARMHIVRGADDPLIEAMPDFMRAFLAHAFAC